MKFDNRCGIQIFFGLIGSGKTTLAANIARKAQRRHIRVFSNMPIQGTLKFELSDLGHYDMSNSIILIDEAGIDFDNRQFKSNFSDKNRLYFFKLIRHYKSSIFLFSQSWSDMDCKIRNLAQKYWYVKKSLIPFFVCAIPVRKSFGINDNEKKPDDIYSLDNPFIRLFTTSRCFAPLNWKLFNSWDAVELEQKDFEIW